MAATGLLILDLLERAGALAAGGFVGTLGTFEIDRGAMRYHRMDNMRLLLR